jgi:ribosomal protein S18 acetylase RimI-like enzyme
MLSGLSLSAMAAREVQFELRPATAADRDRLYAFHRAAMRDVVERSWGWVEAEQRARFNGRFDPAAFAFIVVGGRDVGVLSVHDRAGELYVENVQIAPEEQSRGVGTAVMRSILARAAALGSAVTLQVLKANVRARQLYERLGFYATGEDDVHVRMRHDAGAAAPR